MIFSASRWSPRLRYSGRTRSDLGVEELNDLPSYSSGVDKVRDRRVQRQPHDALFSLVRFQFGTAEVLEGDFRGSDLGVVARDDAKR